ncbi:MAG: sugar phosphate isomerase/epimerase family protein [Chloroflexota bacterium]
MILSLGINTCFAVKRWPRPDDWAPIVGDRLGLHLVQHSLDLVDLDGSVSSTAGDIRRAIDEAGLTLHSTFTGLAAYSSNLLLDPAEERRTRAGRWFEDVIRFTAAVGGRATGGHVGAWSVPEWRDAEVRDVRLRDLRSALDRLSAVARTAGLEYLVVENLAAAREPSTMAMVESLLADGTDDAVPIRLCLDVGHMCVPGTTGLDRDPYAWLRRFGPRAPIVQLQQSDPDGDHHWPFTPERNAGGRIDADLVIDALGESGATESALILEVIPPFEQDDDEVVDDLVASVDYWRDALVRRGVLGS